jgi:hypothetical protein
MGKYIIIVSLFIASQAFAQETPDSAFQYKLNYNVPESPAFSIIGANPNMVMRGSAAQEVVVNFANSFISNDKLNNGIAVDFNPYFVFGGRLKSINEYRENDFKRILANTQLSLATSSDDAFPNDLFVSSGLRITLFDSKDLLQNKKLGSRIDEALAPEVLTDPSQIFGQESDVIRQNSALIDVYETTKEEMRTSRGGAVSIGMAAASRFINSDFRLDSLAKYRNQFWISAQYSFGNGLDLLGLALYKNNYFPSDESVGEVQLGVGIKYLSPSIIIGGEVVYSTEKSDLDMGINIETIVSDKIILFVSIGNRSEINSVGDENKLKVQPGIKYNLSQTGK